MSDVCYLLIGIIIDKYILKLCNESELLARFIQIYLFTTTSVNPEPIIALLLSFRIVTIFQIIYFKSK